MGAFTYPRSEPGSGGHQDLVERLNSNSGVLRAGLAGLPEAALARRPSENEWSIKDIVGHLCDHAQFFHRRLYMMIKLEEPRLVAYDQEALVRDRNAQAAPIEQLLAEFSAQRGMTVDMLADLVHWNWARTGHHEELGRMSIRQLVDRAVAHDEAHLAQIRSLKEAAGA
jgi:uncharacterized damage-inducible protein DinB